MNTEMKELEKIAPELSKIKKENPFRVPDNYFDDFSARLEKRMNTEQNSLPVKKNNIIRYLKPAIGLAAGFALVFSLAYWPLKTFTPDRTADSSDDELSVNDLLFASAVEGIDENSFYELLEKPTESESFSEEEIANYVNTNVSEYELFSHSAN